LTEQGAGDGEADTATGPGDDGSHSGQVEQAGHTVSSGADAHGTTRVVHLMLQ